MISSFERLEKLFSSEKVPHALLFSGSADLEKIAYEFAGKLIKDEKHQKKVERRNHPDIHVFRPEGKTGMHAMQSIRTLIDQAQLVPYEAQRQCFIIADAERMLATSSNALLKTLEEPPSRTYIFLLSRYPDRLLPTLLSRLHLFTFHDEKNEKEDPLQQKLLETLPYLDRFLAEEIAGSLEVLKKEGEKELRTSMVTKDLSALQKESVEKEIEGILNLRMQDQIKQLFKVIIGWYRDRYLLELSISTPPLFYPDRLERLEKTPFIPMPFVEKYLAEAQTGLERSMKIQTCLETLFLKLTVLS